MFLSDEEFASRINANAKRSTEDQRFGDNKVYISDLFGMDDMGLSLADFKRMLAESNRKGLLQLSRADMVQFMPKAKVETSEVAVQNATFHFVRIR